MLKKDLISKSPVAKTIGVENIQDGKFGAVLSRAGVGKTSFLVQIALTQLLCDEKILHVSLDDSMDKINLRYKEGFTNLIDHIGYVDPQKAVRLWEDIKPQKVGISYNDSSFDTSKINDYLKSFKKADLILPAIIIIDGLNFDTDVTNMLDELENLNKEFGVSFWFSMKNHREEELCEDGFPIQLENHKTRFDKAILLQPVESLIEAIILKDGDRTDLKSLLHPANMMLIED